MVCTPHFIANAQEESLAQPTILTCILCRGFCTLVLFISIVFRGTEGSSVVSVIMRPSTFMTKEDC